MDFEIRKNRTSRGPEPLLRERAAYFPLMEQGYSTREAARIVGEGTPATDAADFKAVRDAVRRLVREDVVPREDEIEATDAVPDAVRRKAVEMGLFGYTLPEEHGGLGATLHEDVQLAEHLPRVP
ncbi:acyl-CoA dehydrogenase family protein [Streptomyces sp. NPDC020412]|uniref:acyl-CoA dehydrogenase family protein n=1 Tax=Streptomyces sp. NPDC020412 TaxID=3365073 RepID=UPI00379A46EE